MAEIGTTTRLAVGRTTLAANRTLLAWIRTSISMISFGFTIYKVIQGLQEGATNLPIDLHAARAGMVLTGFGIICLLIGMLEYYMVIKEVRRVMPIPYWRHPFLIAILMLLLSIGIFFSIMLGAL